MRMEQPKLERQTHLKCRACSRVKSDYVVYKCTACGCKDFVPACMKDNNDSKDKSIKKKF